MWRGEATAGHCSSLAKVSGETWSLLTAGVAKVATNHVVGSEKLFKGVFDIRGWS